MASFSLTSENVCAEKPSRNRFVFIAAAVAGLVSTAAANRKTSQVESRRLKSGIRTGSALRVCADRRPNAGNRPGRGAADFRDCLGIYFAPLYGFNGRFARGAGVGFSTQTPVFGQQFQAPIQAGYGMVLDTVRLGERQNLAAGRAVSQTLHRLQDLPAGRRSV